MLGLLDYLDEGLESTSFHFSILGGMAFGQVYRGESVLVLLVPDLKFF